jgi:SAM-dependent methyltransferase
MSDAVLMSPPPDSFAANIARFTGFAELYDRHRASPPAVLAAIAADYTGTARPRLVADLGSGTGLSTRYWAPHAVTVIGIEPTPDMRRVAEAATAVGNVSYREGFSHTTGLPDHSAQVICCMQALHWMEPQRTFEEAARVLDHGGVFVACDYDWPPSTGAWEAEAAWNACSVRARALETERRISPELRQWDKPGHLARMEASGCFRFVKEVLVHHVEAGNADRFVGLLLSQAYITKLLQAGATESEIGLDHVRATAEQTLGPANRDWIWSARVRLGVV